MNIVFDQKDTPPFFPPNSLEEQQFYWEATQAFCTGLDVCKSLERGLKLLQQYIKADMLTCGFLHKNSPKYSLFKNSAQNGRPTEEEIFMPEALRKRVFNTPGSFVRVCDADSTSFLAVETGKTLPKGDWSLLNFRLYMESENILAHLSVTASGRNCYSAREAGFIYALTRPVKILFSNALEYLSILNQNRTLTSNNRLLRKNIHSGILGLDQLPNLRGVYEQVQQVASLNCPVLILGETGVGKELVADALHENSHRAQAPFVKLNCGAMPEHLIDSELFGYEKGAFTNAAAEHAGRFERADKGTLFLDELAELPLPAQIKLLRVLQSGELDRVGGKQTFQVDVRILAATHADLPAMIQKKSFRDDLFYRLNVFPIRIPPLHERPEDSILLANAILQHMADTAGLPCPHLSAGDNKRILTHPWPGNIRELKNLLERAFISWSAKPANAFYIPWENTIETVPATWQAAPDKEFLSLDAAMAQHIAKALTLTQGRINGAGGAAQLLGIHPSTLRSRMDKLNIHYGLRAWSNFAQTPANS